MSSANVHPDLKEQYQRYKILGAGLVVTSILPAATFFIFYSSSSGLAYITKHLLAVAVAFVLEIPLVIGLAYVLAVKRMRFLERSTSLQRSGARQELALAGAYKFTGNESKRACLLELVQDNTIERFPVIPSKTIESWIDTLPDLPATPAPPLVDMQSTQSVYGFVDPETKRPVAVEIGGNVLWLSPPAKAF
ncbi:MAG: hypothetical protein K2X93_07275 [Candidatus Obscuribacterales bacterium]|nr:hypothetical protein [Candidatus Obscuribacterales bacterium]